MITLRGRLGGVLRVESEEQAKRWEEAGYVRETSKKAPAKKAASPKRPAK